MGASKSSGMLTISSVSKSYGSIAALSDVSLTIAPGEFIGLLGPNGAGKSTLMSLVSGLKSPDSGTITLNGKSATNGDPQARHELGLVPQNIALYDELSAEENLLVFGELFGLDRKTLRERIEEGLTAVGLIDRRKDWVKGFSGGMKRRLNIIAALLHRPKVLLCDEPTVGVDPQSRNAIFELLEDLNRKGLTVVYSTHYMEEATRLCSRIAIIDHGKILAQGTLAQLLEQLPSTERIRVTCSAASKLAQPQLEALGTLVTVDGAHTLAVHPDTQLSAVFQMLEKHHVPNADCTLTRPGLEDVFLHLTGKAFRE